MQRFTHSAAVRFSDTGNGRGAEWRRFAGLILVLALCCGVFGCVGSTPRNPENLCSIFRERPDWYRSAHASLIRWQVPIPVMMAIMHKESKFRADARPPRTTCLFIFPGPRLSSAYGYSQAIDSTWRLYQRKTGNRFADRENFEDAIDFVGWYCHLSFLMCGISKTDPYNLYLAYHEGQTGFNQGSYRSKKRIMAAAKDVRRRAADYGRQFTVCETALRGRGGSCLGFF